MAWDGVQQSKRALQMMAFDAALKSWNVGTDVVDPAPPPHATNATANIERIVMAGTSVPAQVTAPTVCLMLYMPAAR
jgi:hypothetical protein